MGIKNKIKELRNRSKSPLRGKKKNEDELLGTGTGIDSTVLPVQVRNALQQKKEFAKEGNIDFRALAFAGGVSVIATSILSIILCVIHLHPLKALIYIYTLLFGGLICILEGQFLQSEKINNMRKAVIEGLPILKYLWGRGALYLLLGSLQMSHYAAMNIVSGMFLMGVGFLYVVIAIHTRRRLRKLKKSLKDERTLNRYFKRFDRDGDGVLDVDEFGSFVANLTGEDMDEDELEGAFGVIDTTGKGYVTLKEVKRWWSGFKDEEEKEDSGGYVGGPML